MMTSFIVNKLFPAFSDQLFHHRIVQVQGHHHKNRIECYLDIRESFFSISVRLRFDRTHRSTSISFDTKISRILCTVCLSRYSFQSCRAVIVSKSPRESTSNVCLIPMFRHIYVKVCLLQKPRSSSSANAKVSAPYDEWLTRFCFVLPQSMTWKDVS